ncbi:MAG: CDGSH iron-sulfur domain-containing protein [Pseudomonadota bacterium]
MSETTIKAFDNGPLMVSNPPKLTGVHGEIDAGERAVLCRCGASKDKPFCDGSHKKAGFSTAPSDAKLRTSAIDYTATIESVEVTVSYTPLLCSHAAECQRLSLEVFNPKARPWVQPEHGTLESLRAVVAACPSGALRLGEGEPARHLDPEGMSITVMKDGPYAVTNIPAPATSEADGPSARKYVLSRCGHSKNKPFCDGTHYDVGWRDDAETPS